MKISNKTKKIILVIDDNSGILFAMKQALELKDYDVHISETFAGIEAIKTVAPDLIFLDISLVGKDGREIARIIKADNRTKHIPIIVLTAYPNADELAKEAEADDFLPKPFDLTKLWEITEKYTRSH